MDIHISARPTISVVELDIGDRCLFTCADGQEHEIVLEHSRAHVVETNLEDMKQPRPGGHTVCRMHLSLRIDGHVAQIVRHVGCDESFYEPRVLFGMRLWFDANQDLFDHLLEDHGPCKPRKRVRLALQCERLRICPVLLHPWCPLPEGGLRIADCYNADDCWLGPYHGADAHGGLDINHPAGTPIHAPCSLDDQWLYNRVGVDGANNNRWQAEKRWGDGSLWMLRVCHVIRMHVEEHRPVEAGTLIADGAGVLTGDHEHSHFVFGVQMPGAEEPVLIDPWILFWQMYRDREATLHRRPIR